MYVENLYLSCGYESQNFLHIHHISLSYYFGGLLLCIYFYYSFCRIHTAYYNDEGVLITNPLMCAKHYFMTNFIYDFIAEMLPTDVFAFASEGMFHVYYYVCLLALLVF